MQVMIGWVGSACQPRNRENIYRVHMVQIPFFWQGSDEPRRAQQKNKVKGISCGDNLSKLCFCLVIVFFPFLGLALPSYLHL